jgi:hypothetical protein
MVKSDISSIKFQDLLLDNNPDLRKEKFGKQAGWLLPQVLAFIGRQKAIRNASGKYDGVLTASAMIKQDPDGEDPDWVKGLLLYIRSSPRGSILPATIKATAEHLRPYSDLVPLFLAAFKKFQNINYSDWENISRIIDEDLYLAMTCNPPVFEDLLNYRKVGSTIKTGKQAGTTKSPTAATSLTSVGDDEFDTLPRLAKIMLCQVWLAHPSFRNEYMILDPNDWDNMPKPLIDTEVFKETTTNLPWDE